MYYIQYIDRGCKSFSFQYTINLSKHIYQPERMCEKNRVCHSFYFMFMIKPMFTS